MEIGLVMGNKSGLSWDLTASQSFEFIHKIYKMDETYYKKRVVDLCEILDVTKHLDKQLRKLSLGERMKMELIAAILHNPRVLFLDEPTIGLDITAKKNVRMFLREIQRNSNITLILTSHDMDDIEKVCDRVIVINKGKKVYDDKLSTLMNDYNSSKFIKVYFETIPNNLAKFDYARVEKVEGETVLFEVNKEYLSRLMADTVASGNVLDIDITSAPLEEIIEDIFKKTR